MGVTKQQHSRYQKYHGSKHKIHPCWRAFYPLRCGRVSHSAGLGERRSETPACSLPTITATRMTSLIAQQVAPNPPFVSYAQNYEDVMLRRALRQVERGFYIDVGAQSPDADSVTKAFSLLGWSGINIEPHPIYSAQLLQLRPNDINLDVALGEKSGTLTMNFVDDSGLSTADEEIANRHAAAGYAVRAQEVKMLTLEEVWRRYVPDAQPVHFLKVDVEGLERAVLAGNDWKTNRPWIVLVEATLPNSQIENHLDWEPILLIADYEFVYADASTASMSLGNTLI